MLSLSDIHDQIRGTSARVLAVSKHQSVEKIQALYDQGQREFAENYVQEALEKITLLSHVPDIKWHLIGPLQKNKIKYLKNHFHLIHSVHSLEIATLINQKCEELKHTQKILLQVNLANENSKSGFSKESLKTAWPDLVRLKNLRLCGLMTMPPLQENPNENRKYFQELKQLLDVFINQPGEIHHPMNELSMGTSSDYQVAAEAGATIIRIGTILFGERQK